MKKEHIVNLQGKDYVLYAGLLEAAHEAGLKRISTHLVQAPNDANGQLAIVTATVEVERGIFSGIGDASPQSVGKRILPHLVRMAETRAKGRALRDALGVLEPPADEAEPDEPAQPAAASGAVWIPATEEQARQVDALRRLVGQPDLKGQVLSAAQAQHEIAHWSALAATTPARQEQYTQLVTMANELQAAGVSVEGWDDPLTIHAYVQEFRRLKALYAQVAANKAHEAAGRGNDR